MNKQSKELYSEGSINGLPMSEAIDKQKTENDKMNQAIEMEKFDREIDDKFNLHAENCRGNLHAPNCAVIKIKQFISQNFSPNSTLSMDDYIHKSQAISDKELNKLKEKAWKYDELCK